MVGKGGEGAAQTVGTDFWKAGFAAGSVGGVPDGIWVAGDGVFCPFVSGLDSGPELGQQEGDGPSGGCIFVFFPIDQGAVFVQNGGAVDIDTPGIQIDILPSDSHNLGAAQTGQAQQNGDLAEVTFDGIQKGGNLFGGEVGKVISNHLGEPDGDLPSRGVLDHGGDKAPGVFQGFCRALPGLHIYQPLPLIGGDIVDTPGHGTLEPQTLDCFIAPDGGGGEDIFPILNILVNGFCQGFAVTLSGILYTGFQSSGLGDAFFFCGFGDGIGFAVQLDTDVPGPGG